MSDTPITDSLEWKNKISPSILRIIEKLELENAALREKVDDWENAVLHALDHRSDEQHCTCVAPLVGKVKQLQRENAALRVDKERLMQALIEAEQNMARCLDEGKLPAWSLDCLRAALDAARKEKPKWPTLEGRLANKLTSTEEAITQLKNTVEISPIANKILEANK